MKKEIKLEEYLFGEGSEEREEEFFTEVERITAFSLIDERPFFEHMQDFPERREENPFGFEEER